MHLRMHDLITKICSQQTSHLVLFQGKYSLLNNGYLHFLEHPSKQHFCSPGHTSSEPHSSSVTPRHLNGGCGFGHFPFFTKNGEN